MALAALEVEIVNKVTNLGAFAEERAAAASALAGGGGFLPIGGGTVNVGGTLSKEEQAIAAAQMAEIETKTKGASAALRDFTSEGNSVARAATAAGVAGGDMMGRFTALGGVMGMAGPVGIGIGAAIVGIGALYEGTKSVIDITRDSERANLDLAQAYATLHEKVPVKVIDDFITKNERFIPSIFDAREGFAQLARAGFDNTQQQRLMNDAMDLAAIKGWTLSASVDALIRVHGGNTRALLDMGISQKEINELFGKGGTVAEHWKEVLALLEPKIRDGRDTTDKLQQAQNRLNDDWQKLAERIGPPVLDFLGGATNKFDDFVNLVGKFNPNDWKGLKQIGDFFHQLGSDIQTANNNFNAWLASLGTTKAAAAQNISQASFGQGQRGRGFHSGRNI